MKAATITKSQAGLDAISWQKHFDRIFDEAAADTWFDLIQEYVAAHLTSAKEAASVKTLAHVSVGHDRRRSCGYALLALSIYLESAFRRAHLRSITG